MNEKGLVLVAVCCKLFALFPFVVVTEGVGLGKFVWWHYLVIFAMFALFFVLGFILCQWAETAGFSAKKKPWALFWSRAAVAVPSIAFFAVVLSAKLSTGLLLYTLPALIIAFFAGHSTFGRGFTDIFTTAWFGLFFVSALIASGLLWFTHDDAISTAGTFQLCFAFGILIVTAAVLTNQTNIDLRTRQRSSGMSVLPSGLRLYNAGLIAAICAVTVGLFLFAKPLAQMIWSGVTALGRIIMGLFHDRQLQPDYEHESEQFGEVIPWEESGNDLFSALNVLVAVGVILLLIRFRKEIFELIKGLFAPLFKERVVFDDIPFTDEFTDSAIKHNASRLRKKTAQQLSKLYKKETDPVLKYRYGYGLFLLRLNDTPFAALPADTTTVHCTKGRQAFRREDIDRVVRVYNDVRYGCVIPDEKELSFQQELLEQIK